MTSPETEFGSQETDYYDVTEGGDDNTSVHVRRKLAESLQSLSSTESFVSVCEDAYPASVVTGGLDSEFPLGECDSSLERTQAQPDITYPSSQRSGSQRFSTQRFMTQLLDTGPVVAESPETQTSQDCAQDNPEIIAPSKVQSSDNAAHLVVESLSFEILSKAFELLRSERSLPVSARSFERRNLARAIFSPQGLEDFPRNLDVGSGPLEKYFTETAFPTLSRSTEDIAPVLKPKEIVESVLDSAPGDSPCFQNEQSKQSTSNLTSTPISSPTSDPSSKEQFKQSVDSNQTQIVNPGQKERFVPVSAHFPPCPLITPVEQITTALGLRAKALRMSAPPHELKDLPDSNDGAVLASLLAEAKRCRWTAVAYLTPQQMKLLPTCGNQFSSVGSIEHGFGTCRPCAFQNDPRKGGCVNGVRCVFCHFPHEKKKKRAVKPQKETRRNFVDLYSGMRGSRRISKREDGFGEYLPYMGWSQPTSHNRDSRYCTGGITYPQPPFKSNSSFFTPPKFTSPYNETAPGIHRCETASSALDMHRTLSSKLQSSGFGDFRTNSFDVLPQPSFRNVDQWIAHHRSTAEASTVLASEGSASASFPTSSQVEPFNQSTGPMTSQNLANLDRSDVPYVLVYLM